MKSRIYVLLLSFYTLVAAGGELKDRQMFEDMAASMFISEQFSELDKTSRGHLESEERTGSGLWKLTLFYAGISELPDQSVRDEDYWKNLEDKALRWIDAYSDSPSGYLVYADILIRHAWMYRGEVLGHEVQPEDWEPFYEHIVKAKEFLNKTKKISSQDPHWYELMIVIARAEGWSIDEFNDLMDEATASDPYFYQIYFAAIDYLTPKWHGSKIEIEKFAQKAVGITQELEKSVMYAIIYWYASQAYYIATLFAESAVVWEKMSVSIDDVLEKYPDQWNINSFAYFSCLAGDANKTNVLIGKIQGKPIIEAWKQMSFFHQCKEWSALNASKKGITIESS